jgi:hypothetical protein
MGVAVQRRLAGQGGSTIRRPRHDGPKPQLPTESCGSAAGHSRPAFCQLAEATRSRTEYRFDHRSDDARRIHRTDITLKSAGCLLNGPDHISPGASSIGPAFEVGQGMSSPFEASSKGSGGLATLVHISSLARQPSHTRNRGTRSWTQRRSGLVPASLLYQLRRSASVISLWSSSFCKNFTHDSFRSTITFHSSPWLSKANVSPS